MKELHLLRVMVLRIDPNLFLFLSSRLSHFFVLLIEKILTASLSGPRRTICFLEVLRLGVGVWGKA